MSNILYKSSLVRFEWDWFEETRFGPGSISKVQTEYSENS